MKVGIPRALLFHFYRDLWTDFFAQLGVDVLISPETNRQIINLGRANCIDEACYSSKIYIGHVAWLIGKCDVIFVPRLENTAIKEDFCTRIIGLYDLVKNTFPHAPLLHADTNYIFRKREQDAYVKIGEQLGKTAEESIVAYRHALATHNAAKEAAIMAQEELVKEPGFKVLIVSHAYNTYDMAVGRAIIDYFKKAGVVVLFADLIRPETHKEKIKSKYGTRMYWRVNAELFSGIEHYRDHVDGIVLVSTFPCGPDSIFNEMIIRGAGDKPVLNIMVDELEATAGLLTRLESFVDILEARKGAVHHG